MTTRRLLSTAALVAGLVALSAGALLAHATLVRSEPARDAHLTWPPRSIRLVFSETVTPATSRIELFTPDSQRVDLVVGADSTGERKSLVAVVPELAVPGTYRVHWRLIGPDGHAVTGRYSFRIDSIPQRTTVSAPPSAKSDTPEKNGSTQFAPGAPFQTLVRFLWTGALLLVFGATSLFLFVVARIRHGEDWSRFSSAVDQRLRWWAKAGCWLLLILAAVRLTSQAATLSGSIQAIRVADLVTILSGFSWGRALAVFVITLVVMQFLLARGSWAAVGGACVILALAAPFLGHPAAANNATLAIGVDAVHVIAAGGWAGALLLMTITALPQAMSLSANGRTPVIRSILRAFSPLALTCAGLLTFSGTIAAWMQLGSVSALWTTPYGMLLIRKLVLVLVVAALGAWHWRVAQPALGSDRSLAALRWSMTLDVVVVLGVIAVTAILTGTAPPGDIP